MSDATMSRDIPITLIDPDANQPRRHFDPQALQELADSLATVGQMMPITVRPVEDRYVIVQGERRWRAAQLAGLTTLRAEVSDIDADAAYLLALIENIQRADLTSLEEATAYERLIVTGYNQTELGKRIGKSQSYIAQKIRLLKMAPEAQEALSDGLLTEGHARQLLRLPLDRINWQRMVERIIGEKWPVRRVRNWVDYELLVWTPQWWTVEGTYKDLADYADRLVNEVRYQYADRDWLNHAKKALKQHQTLLIAFNEARYGPLAEWLLTESKLHILNEWGKRLNLYRKTGAEISTAVKAVITWGFKVDELIWPDGVIAWMDSLPELTTEEEEKDDHAVGKQFWREEGGRRAAWLDQVKGRGLSYEEAMQTPYISMSRDIVAGATESTPETMVEASEVLA